jgi:2-polyprenyl-6-methoxyphenol hydroxylase-like FAD-dependent oxidoreductase
MSNTEKLNCDVTIVGYGPVGITCAALLSLAGLSVVVIERHPARYEWHRAGHYDGETMRIFQRLDVAETIELVSQPLISMQMMTADGEVLSRVESGQDGSGWRSDYLAYQPDYEDAIDARARELGARVFMGTRAVSLEQSDTGVVIHGVSEDGGSELIIGSKYVIGADGANSFVRDAVGAEKVDLGFTAEPHLVVDFEFSDPDVELPLLPDTAQVLDINRPQLSGRWGGRRHTRFEFAARDGESTDDLTAEEFCWQLIGAWGITPEHGTIVRRAVYEFESSITLPWRNGRAILIGDAAHTMPPHMGQGMQSGLRDAENLAWKLAAVISGEVDERLLDSYQPEREPHVRALIAMSSALGEAILITDPEKAAARNAMLRAGNRPPPRFPRLGAGIIRDSESPAALDLPGTDGRPGLQARVALDKRVDRLDNLLPKFGWRIVSRHPIGRELFDQRQLRFIDSLGIQFAHVSRGATGDRSFWDIDAQFDAWYQRTGRRAFLERPDHYVFGTAEEIADVPRLIDELAASLAAYGWQDAYAKEPA